MRLRPLAGAVIALTGQAGWVVNRSRAPPEPTVRGWCACWCPGDGVWSIGCRRVGPGDHVPGGTVRGWTGVVGRYTREAHGCIRSPGVRLCVKWAESMGRGKLTWRLTSTRLLSGLLVQGVASKRLRRYYGILCRFWSLHLIPATVELVKDGSRNGESK